MGGRKNTTAGDRVAQIFSFFQHENSSFVYNTAVFGKLKSKKRKIIEGISVKKHQSSTPASLGAEHKHVVFVFLFLGSKRQN